MNDGFDKIMQGYDEQQIQEFKNSMKQFAGLMWTYFRALTDCGFEWEMALKLTAEYQNTFVSTMVSNAKNSTTEKA